MKIYIDKNFLCHTEQIPGTVPVDVDFFDGKCETFIEGYRYIPAGEKWTRDDGAVFTGEMLSPWRDSRILSQIQREYEKILIQTQQEHEQLKNENIDMKNALEIMGVNVNG